VHRIRWDDLQVVLAVADGGSVAAASRTLGVNHTTVLRRLGAFEERHGVQLFERHARGYKLTAESKHFLNTVRSIEEAVEGLERTIAGQGTSIEGRLTLTSTDSLCQTVLVRHVRAFQEKHPAVVIDLMVTNTRLNFSRLDADITVRPARELPPDLAGERVCALGLRVYGAAAYLARNESTDAGRHRWLTLSQSMQRPPIRQWQESLIPNAAIAMSSDSFVALRNAAELGLGLALLPCCLGDPSESLVRVPMFPDRIETNIWIAAHPDLIGAPLIQAGMQFFVEAVRGDEALLSGDRPG
jgi:DNA-binding transcriptional LysR family regulator